MKTRTLLFVATCAFVLGSCKEELTKVELLTAKDWRLTSLTIDPPIMVEGVLITNYYGQMYAYDKDNILRFYANGTVETDEGAPKNFQATRKPSKDNGNFRLPRQNLLFL
jgi:hypothetical protein